MQKRTFDQEAIKLLRFVGLDPADLRALDECLPWIRQQGAVVGFHRRSS